MSTKLVKVRQSVSGYVWGGIRLPRVGETIDLPAAAADSLIGSGHVVPAEPDRPVEAASVDPDGDVETAAAPKPARKRSRG